MLRRILQRTPGRVGSQSSDSDSSAAPGNAVDVNNESTSEGFICPMCMKSHGSAEELFKHYEVVHGSGIDSSHGGDEHPSPKRKKELPFLHNCYWDRLRAILGIDRSKAAGHKIAGQDMHQNRIAHSPGHWRSSFHTLIWRLLLTDSSPVGMGS
uniref:Early endosome antigen 1 n=1 Tax=Chrysemys picta bellii TaxID=8478 RepID=A0A8C3IUX3_CHRPI